jgi:hypothetical protein
VSELGWKCVNENAGTRTLSVTANLRRLATFDENGQAGDCGYRETLHGTPLAFGQIEVWLAGFMQFGVGAPEAVGDVAFHQTLTQSLPAPAHSCEYEGGTYGPNDVVDETVEVLIEAVGTIKRYVYLDYPGSSKDIDANRAYLEHWNPFAEVMSHCTFRVKDVVESYTVTMSIGGVPTVPSTFNVTVPEAYQTSVAIQVSPRAGGINWNDYVSGWGAWNVHALDTTVFVEGTYSRSPGAVCSQSRYYEKTTPDAFIWQRLEGDPLAWVDHYCDAFVRQEIGNGAFRLVGGSADINANLLNEVHEDMTVCFGCSIDDQFGAYEIPYDEDFAMLDGTARNGLDLATQEGHPVLDKDESDPQPAEGCTFDFNGDTEETACYDRSWPVESVVPIVLTTATGFTINYGGKAIFTPVVSGGSSYGQMECGAETYWDHGPLVEVDGLNFAHHGDLSIKDVIGGEVNEGSLHEPSHPPWLPLPAGDPETTPRGDPWYDDIPLLKGPDALLAKADALVIALCAPGSTPGTPLEFAKVVDEVPVYTWIPHDCESAIVNERLQVTVPVDVTTAYVDAGDILSTKTRLTGTSFALVRWQASVDGAQVKLHLGSHWWLLTANGTGEQSTEINLCRPTGTGAGGNGTQQSIVPFERPCDLSVWDTDHADRAAESIYPWEYPAGWGVGIVKTLKLDCPTPNCVYKFHDLWLKRKSIEDGGFAKLYVLPQSGPWNDSRDYDATPDFAVDASGIIEHALGGGHHSDYVSVLPKARLVIDGAVVWELAAGSVRECTSDDNLGKTPSGHETWYLHELYALTRIRKVGFPLDDYVTPTPSYAVNGAATITPDAFTGDQLFDTHCLAAFLVGGVYTPNQQNQISVPLKIMPRAWEIVPGTDALPTGCYKRFRAQVNGLAWGYDGQPRQGLDIALTAVDAPAGEQNFAAETNKIGWFEFDPVYTQSPVAVASEELGEVPALPVRSRKYSRCVLPLGVELWPKYCAETGIPVLTTEGKPALTCCEE